MKYLVYAFYPSLGIPVRVVDFKSKREMFDYVSGLRMTDTAYAIQDISNRDKPTMIELEFSPEVGISEMAQMLKEWTERKSK